MEDVSFDPPLWLQRQTWVLSQLRQHQAATVLEVGCSTAPLLQAVLPAPLYVAPREDWIEQVKRATKLEDHAIFQSCPVAPRRVTVMDIDCNALQQPIDVLDEELQRGSSSGFSRRWGDLHVKVLCGSLADNFWEQVGDVDVAVATEVIEHLDTAVLACFAPSLLGMYRPRVLLVTTPNHGFNARFGSAGMYADPTQRTSRLFRHHDHRFEWDTHEFEAWCNNVAITHGYSVTVGGLGEGLPRPECEGDPTSRFASQTAVFVQLPGSNVMWAPKPRPSTPVVDLDYHFPAFKEDSVGDDTAKIVEATMNAIVDFGERKEAFGDKDEGHAYEADIWSVWMCPYVRGSCHGRLDRWFDSLDIALDGPAWTCSGSVSLSVRDTDLVLACRPALADDPDGDKAEGPGHAGETSGADK